MSELTDLVIQVGQRLGWDFVLLVSFLYELYCPESIHQTKLQRLMKRPNPGVVAALKAIAGEIDGVSPQLIVEELENNGVHAWDFSTDYHRDR